MGIGIGIGIRLSYGNQPGGAGGVSPTAPTIGAGQPASSGELTFLVTDPDGVGGTAYLEVADAAEGPWTAWENHAYDYVSGSWIYDFLVTGLGNGTTKYARAYTRRLGLNSAYSTTQSGMTTPPPVANFNGSPTSGMAPLLVSFSSTGSGQVDTYSWSSGDGDNDSNASPSFSYELPGVYSPSLSVSGPTGSDDETKTGYITVGTPAPSLVVAQVEGEGSQLATTTSGRTPYDVRVYIRPAGVGSFVLADVVAWVSNTDEPSVSTVGTSPDTQYDLKAKNYHADSGIESAFGNTYTQWTVPAGPGVTRTGSSPTLQTYSATWAGQRDWNAQQSTDGMTWSSEQSGTATNGVAGVVFGCDPDNLIYVRFRTRRTAVGGLYGSYTETSGPSNPATPVVSVDWNAGTSCIDVSISGLGTPASVTTQARLNGGSWVTIDTTASPGDSFALTCEDGTTWFGAPVVTADEVDVRVQSTGVQGGTSTYGTDTLVIP